MNAGAGVASQARHQLVSQNIAVRFANRGLGYEPFAWDGKLAYIQLNRQMPDVAEMKANAI